MQGSISDPITRATSLLQSGALAEAQLLVRRSLVEHPASSPGLTLAGHIGIRRSALTDAIRSFDRAARAAATHDPRMLLNLARAQELAGRTGDALLTAERAAALFPGDPKANGLVALLSLAAGRPANAARVLGAIDISALDPDTAFKLGQKLSTEPAFAALSLRLLERAATAPGRFVAEAARLLAALAPPAEARAYQAARRVLVLIPDAGDALDAIERALAARRHPVKRAAWLWRSSCLHAGDLTRLVAAADLTFDVKWPTHGIAANRLLLKRRPDNLEITARICVLFARHHELSKAKPMARQEAVAWARSIIADDPANPRIWDAIAGMLKDVEAYAEAHELWPRIIAKFPGFETLHYNRGLFLDEQEHLAAATRSLRRALVLKPDYQKPCNVLSLTTARRHELNAAVVQVRRAIAIDPRQASAWINLGSHLRAVGRYGEAIAAFASSELRGDAEQRAAGRFNRGMTHLSIGELETGFNLIESRWATRGFPSPKRNFRQPIWRGPREHPNAGLLAYMEQGLGDEVMLSWYLPLLRGDTRRLVVDCDERLVSVFGRTYEGIEFVARSLGGHEATKGLGLRFKIPSLHVPQYYVPELKFLIRENWDWAERRGERFPARLVVEPTRLQHWDRWLEERFPGRRRLALSWRSKMRTRTRDAQYVSLEELVAAIPAGTVGVNLQYSSTAEELDELKELAGHRNVEIVTPEGVDLTNDLDDIFALLQVCDAAVTPLISLAWMAGAVGCPGYVFRTARERATWHQFGTPFIPWAPSLRLFIRDPSEGWNSTIKDMHARLTRFLESDPPRYA